MTSGYLLHPLRSEEEARREFYTELCFMCGTPFRRGERADDCDDVACPMKCAPHGELQDMEEGNG